MQKGLLKLALLSVALLLMPIQALAQTTNFNELSQTEDTSPVVKDVAGLRLKLIQHTQNPEDKGIKFDLVITPSFSTDRTQITWQLVGVSEAVTETVQQISLQAGVPATVSFTIRPRGLGATDVRAKVEAFAADGTYSATASKTLGTYESGEVFPITNDYRIAQVLVLVKNVALIAVVILGVFLLVRFGYKQLRNRAFEGA